LKTEQPPNPKHTRNRKMNMKTENTTDPLDAELAAIKQQVIDTEFALRALEAKKRDIQAAIRLADFGIKVGMTVKSGRNGKLYQVARLGYFYSRKSEPSLEGYPIKKDGTPGERIQYIGEDWTIEPQTATEFAASEALFSGHEMQHGKPAGEVGK